MRAVTYAKTKDPVLPGDIVTTRVLLWRRKARVVYVPGISQKRASLEHHGLQWVGFQEFTGPFFSALVDPKTLELDKTVTLVERGTPVDLAADRDPFIEPGDVVDEER